MSAAAHHFKKPQGVDNFFIAPLIAGDNRDAKDFNLRRLNERGKRLHVAAARAGAVLVDDDLRRVWAAAIEAEKSSTSSTVPKIKRPTEQAVVVRSKPHCLDQVRS